MIKFDIVENIKNIYGSCLFITEHEIDEMSFHCLTVDLIKDLFRNKTGPQAKFLYHWQTWNSAFSVKVVGKNNFDHMDDAIVEEVRQFISIITTFKIKNFKRDKKI